MNWTQIQKKYPKALLAFIKWLAYSVEVKIEKNELVAYLPITRTYRFQKREVVDPRRLYDFFDKKGIHPEIGTDNTRHGYGIILWAYTVVVWKDDKPSRNWSSLYRSRPKAETDAFIKSFELLESTL